MDKRISLVVLIFILFLTVYLRWNDHDFLTGADPYYHYRKADEILNHEISDTDHLRRPPEGIPYKKNFYHYFTAYSYKLIPFINLEEYMVYLPLVFSLISVIIAYKIGKIFNVYSGLFSAFFVAATPIIVERTNKTFGDTDALVLLFMLLLVYLYIKFYTTENTLYLVFLGVILFIFQSFWSGYWLFVYIFLGSLFFYSVFEMRKDILNLRYFLIPSVVYIVPATFYSSRTLLFLLHLYRYNLNPVEIQKAYDVSKTVGELVKITPHMLIPHLGVILPLGIMGFIALGYLTCKEKRYYPLSLMLFLLLIFSILTLQGGYRFLFLFAVPLLISSSILLGMVFQNLWRMRRSLGVILIISILSLSLYDLRINKRIERVYPDDDFREAMSWINENLEKDAVIIAWWDYGYWIEALGRRSAYVDNGYRPNSKVIWYAEMLTSENTDMLHELQFKDLYIILTDRELYNFEMISYFLGENLQYMVRFPKKTEEGNIFSTFYDEKLIFKKNGEIKIGKNGNYRPFNGYVYSMKEYRVVYPHERLPSRIFVIDPKLEKVLFTELYIHDAKNIPDIKLIKNFKKMKIFKVDMESEKDE